RSRPDSFFFFQAEDGIRDFHVTGVQTCALPILGGSDAAVPDVDTAVAREDASRWLEALTHVPEGFNLNPKLGRTLKARREMARGNAPLDWAAGEALAFASLVAEGRRVRLSGQDSERGTFSHRHSVFHDTAARHAYVPLAELGARHGG